MLQPRELKLFSELLIEANAQLGHVKLPKKLFGKYENLIKLTHYEQFRKLLNEDPMLNHKRRLIQEHNLKFRDV